MAWLDRHAPALGDVVDVRRDRRVRADAVLLHQRDQLGLAQVRRRRRLALEQRNLHDGQRVAGDHRRQRDLCDRLCRIRKYYSRVEGTIAVQDLFMRFSTRALLNGPVRRRLGHCDSPRTCVCVC